MPPWDLSFVAPSGIGRSRCAVLIAVKIEEVFQALGALGVILLVVAAVIAVADSGGLSSRMPTQVPRRRVAVVPLVVGVALLVVAAVGLATS